MPLRPPQDCSRRRRDEPWPADSNDTSTPPNGFYNDPVPTRLTLPPVVRQAFDRLAADLQRVFGDRFVALVASGVHASVAFATDIRPDDLDTLAPLTETWSRDDLDAPLVLTPHEFRRSLDTFPMEYQALLDRHTVIAGTPPFENLVIDPDNLRRACEVQAKSHVIHLRQGWLHSGGDEAQLAALLERSAPALRALLSDIARLHGSGGEADALAGARTAGVDLDLTRELLQLEDTPRHAHALVRRLPECVVMAEQLWAFVDTWTS